MYAIGFTEVLFVLISFLLFYKYNLTRIVITRLFKGIVIYLPLTNEDFEELIKRRKSKAKKENGMIRSCDIEEYTQKTKEPTFFNFNFIVTFFLCNVFVIVLNEIKNFILVIVNIRELEAESSFNIIASFSMVTFMLFVYMFIKDAFKSGVWHYDSKVFYCSFIIGSVAFYLIELLQPSALGMNLDSVNTIVNDRFNKINEKASSHYKISLLCTIDRLRVFFAIVFGLFIAILFKPSMRLAYFDNFLLITESKRITIDKSFNYKRLAMVVKVKILLNIFILFLLVDTLAKSPLQGMLGHIIGLWIYIILFIIAIVIETSIGLYTLWYDAFFFHLQNYTEVLKFSSQGTKESLLTHRVFVYYLNSRFWDITLHVFALIAYPLLLALVLYSRSQLPLYLYERIAFKSLYTIKDTIQLKVYFFENAVYVIALAFAFAKGVLCNANVFYMRASNQMHSSLY